jgi:hypothetical protein
MEFLPQVPIINNQSQQVLHPQGQFSLTVAGRDYIESPMDEYSPDVDEIIEDVVESIEPTKVMERMEMSSLPARIKCDNINLPANSLIKFGPDLSRQIEIFTDINNSTKTRASSQRIVERELIKRGRCSSINPDLVNDYRLHLFTLNDDKLNDILGSPEGLNNSIHQNISCILDAIIYEGKEPGLYSPPMRERVRNWFPNIKQIGADSIEGYALAASLSESSNLFVIKAPRNPKNDELAHEAVVGFYALNKLRQVLPNYMYVYGYTTCSPPAIKDKELLTWCSSSNPGVSYLITENIRDSVSIGDFIRDPNTTPDDFIAVFLQLINALNLAYNNYKYTHYDLHYGNIMVRKYNKIIAIPYYRGKFRGYIVSRYVPYIIDYGYSCVSIGGVFFGKMGLEKFGITNSPFPMYDTYKIICFLAEKIHRLVEIRNNRSNTSIIFQIIDKLFSFFEEGRVYTRVITRINRIGDFYACNSIYKNINHQNYLEWLEKQIAINIYSDLSIFPEKDIFVLPVNDKLDTCQFSSLVTTQWAPQTNLEYCETIAAIKADSKMSPTDKEEFLSWLVDNYDPEEYINATLDVINEKIAKANSLKSDNRVSKGIIIPQLSANDDILNLNFITNYKSHIYALLQIKDITSNLVSYVRSAICALGSRNKITKYKSVLVQLNKIASDMVIFVRKNREILQNNVKYANMVKWNFIAIDSTILKFWTSEHETLSLAV